MLNYVALAIVIVALILAWIDTRELIAQMDEDIDGFDPWEDDLTQRKR